MANTKMKTRTYKCYWRPTKHCTTDHVIRSFTTNNLWTAEQQCKCYCGKWGIIMAEEQYGETDETQSNN